MNNAVAGSLESLDQMITFIDGLSDSDYRYIATPWFESSIGQHLRHIVDLYLALMTPSNKNAIDYDVRRRGAPIETNKSTGLKELADIRCWLMKLTANQLSQQSIVSTEVSLSTQQSEKFVSSFGRELCFASSHLIHHLAIMATIAKMAGKTVDPTLGLAPATATYTREQEKQPCAH